MTPAQIQEHIRNLSRPEVRLELYNSLTAEGMSEAFAGYAIFNAPDGVLDRLLIESVERRRKDFYEGKSRSTDNPELPDSPETGKG